MSEPPSAPSALCIATVIATCNRLALLKNRALRSVREQTRCPDYLVVVDDSDESLHPKACDLVHGMDVPGCRIAYLDNSRSPGASGAWNTAIDFLFGEIDDPENVFVAILDDDDSWDSTYLERCATFAEDERCDMVAADLRRIESKSGAPLRVDAPPALNAPDFLTENPGIQGSNLFLRLSVLLAAGGFDEALRSTTDRDLCIRIAELETVRYGRLPVALIDHFAEPDRPRLSTHRSPAKLEGLTAFQRKYTGRMTDEQKQAFAERAAALFGWSTPPEPNVCGSFKKRIAGKPEHLKDRRTAPAVIAKVSHRPPFQLYAGVITSDPPTLGPLLHGLAALGSSETVQGIAVLILDNGSPPSELDAVIREAQDKGLKVAVVDEARQRKDASAGAFGADLRARPGGQVEIAQARTMLQRYLGAVMEADDDAFGWVLDDDMRVDARAEAYLPWLPEFRDQGTDVLIGAYEGAAPAPPPTGLRVHLVDLLHNLHWLRNLPSDALLPDRTEENANLRAQYPDYHYDLSRKHTGHLEAPYWLEPAFHGETVAEAHSRLLADADGILNGEPFTRPLVASMPSKPTLAAMDSVNRGGCTFILNHRALTQTPNTIIRIRDSEARRSDMIWAIVNRHYRRMRIKAVGFPVHHAVRTTEAPGLDIAKVQGEIVGSSLYAGLTEFLSAKPHHMLDFSTREAEEVHRLANLHLDRRWQSLERNFHRITGLREAIRRLTEPDELRELTDRLERWFTPEGFRRISSGLETHDGGDIVNFLASLRETADDFAAATINIDFISAQFKSGVTKTEDRSFSDRGSG